MKNLLISVVLMAVFACAKSGSPGEVTSSTNSVATDRTIDCDKSAGAYSERHDRFARTIERYRVGNDYAYRLVLEISPSPEDFDGGANGIPYDNFKAKVALNNRSAIATGLVGGEFLTLQVHSVGCVDRSPDDVGPENVLPDIFTFAMNLRKVNAWDVKFQTVNVHGKLGPELRNRFNELENIDSLPYQMP